MTGVRPGLRPRTQFWHEDTYRIVEKMKASGNQPGVIALWKNMVAHWAERAAGPDAEAVKAFLPLWQARAFYTAAELAPIFPVLAVALGLRDRPGPQKSPERLAYELEWSRLPWVRIDGTQYFVVEQTHRAKDMVHTIKEFHDAQHG